MYAQQAPKRISCRSGQNICQVFCAAAALLSSSARRGPWGIHEFWVWGKGGSVWRHSRWSDFIQELGPEVAVPLTKSNGLAFPRGLMFQWAAGISTCKGWVE